MSSEARLSFSERETTKYYKLKSDLPTFKTGDVFKINWSGHLEYVKGAQTVKEGQELIAYTKMTLDKFPDILKDWFEEMPGYAVYTKWRAKIGEKYWFISDEGDVFSAYELGASTDTNRWNRGNYYKTEGDTKKHQKYLKALNILLTDASGGEYVDGGDNWTAVYDCYRGIYDISDNVDVISVGNNIWFQNVDDIENSLKKHRDEWNIVRDYRRKKK